MTSPAASGRRLSKFKKTAKNAAADNMVGIIEVRKAAENAASDGFVCISLMQRQRRLHISRVKYIGNVFELGCVAFRLAPS